MTNASRPSPCPRCGSADVALQPKDGLELSSRGGPSATESAVSASVIADGPGGLIIDACGVVIDLIFGLLGGIARLFGHKTGKPARRRQQMVHFCHDCGWSQDVNQK